MFAIKHILFPIDFSERCNAAAPRVAAFAAIFGAKVTLLNVVPPIWLTPMEAAPIAIDLNAIKRGWEIRLNGSFVTEFQGMDVQRLVEIGVPGEYITEFAEKREVDLIMMPTHGYGPFREFLLGSVTAKVLHDCNIPVWTSAHIDEPTAPIHDEVRTVLCAVDVPAKSKALLESASELARSLSAELRLVHVVPAPTAWPDPFLGAKLEKEIIDELCLSFGELQKSLDILAPLCIEIGDVATGVREAARRYGADLIAIGRGVGHERLGRLRTNAYAIIRRSPCPVISF